MLNSDSHLHGSLLSIGEIMKGLSRRNWAFSSQVIKVINLLKEKIICLLSDILSRMFPFSFLHWIINYLMDSDQI